MKLAIFDLDGTLITVETLPFILKAWGRLGYSRLRQLSVMVRLLSAYLLYKTGLIPGYDKEIFRRRGTESFLKLFKGMDSEEIDEFFNQCVDLLRVSFNERVVDQYHLLRSQGYHMVLLSGGYLPFVRGVGAHFGFDTMIGSAINMTIKGYIDYENPIDVIMGDRKLSILIDEFEGLEIQWADSIALADSYYDISLLSQVGHPIAVRPDQQLMEYARNQGWKILE